MKEVTKEMIDLYNIKKLGYDFMGYTFNSIQELSFHHLIVPHRKCKEQGLGDGYLIWNGAILKQSTSHDYLHIIEKIDWEAFFAITNLLIQENQEGKINIEILKDIRKILILFEKFHKNDVKSDGKKLIRQNYITNRIQL